MEKFQQTKVQDQRVSLQNFTKMYKEVLRIDPSQIFSKVGLKLFKDNETDSSKVFHRTGYDLILFRQQYREHATSVKWDKVMMKKMMVIVANIFCDKRCFH